MKILNTLIVLISLTVCTLGQSYTELYKTGTLQLVPDSEYAKNTNWAEVFPDYDQTVYGNPIGIMKGIAVDNTGELFVGNYSSYSISKFDASGNYLKNFGKKGFKDGQFAFRPTLHGILDNKYVFASDHDGRIQFFNLDGSFYKMVKLDYMPLKIVALRENKIGILGHVPYSGKSRCIVAIKDIETGEENIVYSYFDGLNYIEPIKIKLKQGMIGFSIPRWADYETIIGRTHNGNLIIGDNNVTSFRIFDITGKEVQTVTMDIEKRYMTEEQKQEHKEKLKTELEKRDLLKDVKDQIENMKFQPYLPFYYTITTDSEGNFLVFTYNDDQPNHTFKVYDKAGNFVCDTKINSEDLKLNINYRFETLIFHKIGIFAFVREGETDNYSIKLIRTSIGK